MQTDPLLEARRKIAIYSLQRSHARIQKQRKIVQEMDQIQIDNHVDQIVYNSLDFHSLCTLYADTSSVTRGRFAQNGNIYVTVGATGEGKVWVPGDGSDWKVLTQMKTVDKLCDVAIHPHIGKIPSFAPNILTGTNTGQLLIWTYSPNLPQQKCIKQKIHEDRISSVLFHQSGSTFYTASYDKTWSIWDSTRIKQLSNQKGHNKQIHTCCLHPDGSLLLTADLGGDAMVWDLRTGKGIYQISSNHGIVCSDFHPNGYELAIGGKNNMISIFDLRRKKQIKLIPAHLKLVSDLTYSEDGSLLFSSGHDRIVKIWHGRSYCGVGNQLQHPNKISSISFCEGTLGVTMIDRKFTIWSNESKIQIPNENNHQKMQAEAQ